MSAQSVSNNQFVFGAYASRTLRPVPAPETWRHRYLRDRPLSRLLGRVFRCVTEAVPSATAVGVTLTGRAEPGHGTDGPGVHTEVVGTAPVVETLLGIEVALGEGPIRAAIESGDVVVAGRLGSDDRWPQFGPASSEHRVSSAVMVPLRLAASAKAGALAMYSDEEDAFGAADVRLLEAFEGVVARVIENDQLVQGAQRILENSTRSRVVDQAVGILMGHNCTEEQAVARLTRISARAHQTLAAAAQMIVDEARQEAYLEFIARGPRHQ